MSKFKCEKCEKAFKTYSEHKKHVNKKYDCTEKYEYYEKKPCEFCKKVFCNKYSLLSHQATCKDKNQEEMDKLKEQLAQIQDKITSKQVLKKKYVKKSIGLINEPVNNANSTNAGSNNANSNNANSHNMTNSNNTHNTTNTNSNNITTNNINIQVLPFDKAKNFLSHKEIVQVLKRGYRSLEDYITIKHFDISHPENHNIYISNNRDKYVNTFDGADWNLQDKNTVIEKLYTDNTDYLIDIFNGLLDELDSGTITKFNRFKSDYEADNKSLESIKENIKLILYNKRKLIISTKSNSIPGKN